MLAHSLRTLKVPAASSTRSAAAAATTSRALGQRSLTDSRSNKNSAAAAEQQGKTAAQRELADVRRIDELLEEAGRNLTTPKNRSGIPMLADSPYTSTHYTPSPWSFSFDPHPRSKQQQATSTTSSPSSSSSSSTVANIVNESSKAERKHKGEADLPPGRHMFESYVEINLALKSKPGMLRQYVSTSGALRIGKIMEHIDSLAGAIAYKHVFPKAVMSFEDATEQSGVYIATAGADRLDLFKPLVVQDLRLSGQVAFVGSSSMEVFVKMEGLREDGPDETLLLGRFTMVARDSQSHGARKVAPLIVESPAEKALFELGKGHKRRKKEASRNSLTKVPPTAPELAELHAFMLRGGSSVVPGGVAIEPVKMSETVTQADFLMHPQERNLHGMVFGGYLMRLAYELSYSNVVIFARSPMRFLSLDEISFQQPVPIGSVLHLTATVTHCSRTNQVHSQVTADVVDVSTGVRKKTNDFHFTWLKDDDEPLAREVIPVTYFESMAWIEGRRRLDVGDKMRGLALAPLP